MCRTRSTNSNLVLKSKFVIDTKKQTALIVFGKFMNSVPGICATRLNLAMQPT